jgi:gas vesicle protein
MTGIISKLEELFEEQHDIGKEIDFLEKHFDGFKPLYAKELFDTLKAKSQDIAQRINQITNQIKNEIEKIN